MGLDIGTTGCKALVIDADGGAIVGRSFREYGMDAGTDGKAEQNAEQVWTLAKTVMREALAGANVPEVAAVATSVQGDTVIAVDADGAALAPAILGMDYRCRAELPAVAERFDGFELFGRTGMRPHPINAFLKMLWLRRALPEVFSRAKRLVTYSDFVMGRMGCPGVIDACTASRTMCYHLVGSVWDGEILAAFDFPDRLLSTPIPPGSAAGTMSRSLADELGLSNPPAVVAGGHDQPVAAIGAGAVTGDIAVASTGTAEVLSRTLDAPQLSPGMYNSYYPCYRSAMNGKYFTFSLNHVGGLALRWFRDNWSAEEARLAAETGRDAYAVMDDAMPGDPTDIFVMPHFNGSGTPNCDLSSRAAIVGMTLSTDRHTVALALLEGLTFELRINLDRMRELGMATSRLRNVGGGSRSARWMQLKADILGVPVDAMRDADAACVGAAVLAGVGAGAFGSVAAGAARLARTARTFEPRPEPARRYAGRFEKYKSLHGTLAPFYAACDAKEGS
ncbi:MAG: hypothetical protein LBT97_11595 [Planctomycetota bacterium]|jgi:xylulokinase|nr:hypothetical protein [Planctomycetota bacterium]